MENKEHDKNIENKEENNGENKEKADIYSQITANAIIENDENINENEISRSTIKNVYGNDYDQIIRSFKHMEEKAKKYFKDVVDELEIKYEEFNSNIITMFFNYISSTTIIPNSFKNNRYFLKEFLKIIVDLLINEIDFATTALIFDYLGWIKEGEDPWLYIYFICLNAKSI